MIEITPRERALMIATEILENWDKMKCDTFGADIKDGIRIRDLQRRNADAAVDLANAVLEWIITEPNNDNTN